MDLFIDLARGRDESPAESSEPPPLLFATPNQTFYLEAKASLFLQVQRFFWAFSLLFLSFFLFYLHLRSHGSKLLCFPALGDELSRRDMSSGSFPSSGNKLMLIESRDPLNLFSSRSLRERTDRISAGMRLEDRKNLLSHR